MKHFRHAHFLDWHWWGAEASCGICNRSIQQWQREYACIKCQYHIHEECAEFPEHINHSLHPLHPFKLAKRSLNNDTCCYYCENPFNNDEYVYGYDDQVCSNFGVHMHMTCATVPLPTIMSHVNSGQDPGALTYVCHQKPMILVEHLDHNKRIAKCFTCRLEWSSSSAYCCTYIECENFLHKSCAELPQKLQHPFHPHHPLILQVGNRSCRSCCKKSSRLIFSCIKNGCNFNLGIECAFLNTTVRCRSHDHSLSLVEKSSCTIQCQACLKSYKNPVHNEINHTQSLVFRSMNCDFNYHFLCGPLPSTIKYEYHMYRLILHYQSIIKDDPEEYFCDVCEEEMDQSFRFYNCEECKYTAHIHCLISEIKEAIKGDANDKELKILGEQRWNQYLGMESPGPQVVNLTLTDIMDKLTEQEKGMLTCPFASADSSRRGHYIHLQTLNSRFNLEGSNEDTDRLLQFFLFGSRDDDFWNFYWEFTHFTVEEGLLKLLEDKHLRQQVDDVHGYMVPRTLVPVLRTLVHKYGDLGGKRSLSSAMKSVTSTLLCIVIEKVCKTKVEDITRDDLRHYHFYLKGIEDITAFEINRFFYHPYFSDFPMKAFLGFEAIRCEKATCKNLDNKIAMLKAELERCEHNREKFKTQKPHSDFMKTCLSEASKWENKYWGDKWF